MAAAAPKYELTLTYKDLAFPIDFGNQCFLPQFHGAGCGSVAPKHGGSASSSVLLSGKQYLLHSLSKMQRWESVFKFEWQFTSSLSGA